MGAVIEHDVVVKDRYDLAIERLPLTPRQARAVRTVRSMLVAADQMIQAEGFDRFTSADVASAAGVSIGIFYRYFRDRVAVLDALYPDRYELLRPGALAVHDAEVLEKEAKRLRGMVTGYTHESPHLRAGRDIITQIEERAAALRRGER